MKTLLVTSFILTSLISFGQWTDFYECPIKATYRFVNDAELFRPYYSTNGQDSFFTPAPMELGNYTLLKYDHYFDCSGTGHLWVTASFIWQIRREATSFEISFSNSDSTEFPLMYATSGRKSYVFYMTNGSGKIKGYLDKGEWHVSGEVKVQMINTFSNTTVTKDIILDGTYELFKNPKKKGYHPLFFF